MATLHKGDNDAIIIVILFFRLVFIKCFSISRNEVSVFSRLCICIIYSL